MRSSDKADRNALALFQLGQEAERCEHGGMTLSKLSRKATIPSTTLTRPRSNGYSCAIHTDRTFSSSPSSWHCQKAPIEYWSGTFSVREREPRYWCIFQIETAERPYAQTQDGQANWRFSNILRNRRYYLRLIQQHLMTDVNKRDQLTGHEEMCHHKVAGARLESPTTSTNNHQSAQRKASAFSKDAYNARQGNHGSNRKRSSKTRVRTNHKPHTPTTWECTI